MRSIAVIGKNFGDEGKGLAVDFFSMLSKNTLVVRHNGGAQSGHTVELKEPRGKSFVFHELSSGSFRGAQTLWINSFYPDMYKLGEEVEDFKNVSGFLPDIYATEDTNITIPDDILINMLLETSRGDNRHGSCGMGINECDLRTKAGYGINLYEIKGMDAEKLFKSLLAIRNTYVKSRLAEIGGSKTNAESEYFELLSDENVLKNAAEVIIDNMKYITILSDNELREKLCSVETLVFEAGQGLMLDCENKEYSPNVTASKTGLKNPCEFLGRMGYTLDEAVYVSRTYVTRHGAGLLKFECPIGKLGEIEIDTTNQANEWQGRIRYACHENENSFVEEIKNDLLLCTDENVGVSLFLTHLNETYNCVVMSDKHISKESFVNLSQIKETFSKFYFSDSRYSEDVKVMNG